MDQSNTDPVLDRMPPRMIYPPVKRKPKVKGAEYKKTEQIILNAIADFKAEKYSTLKQAARAHGLNSAAEYTRLCARAAGRASKSDRIINGSQRLTPEQETELCHFVDSHHSLHDVSSLHRKIRDRAYEMLCAGRSPEHPRPRPLGQQWPYRFLERHPGIIARPSKQNPPPVDFTANQPETTVQSSSAGEEVVEDPQLLADCQQFLDHPTPSDPSGTSDTHTNHSILYPENSLPATLMAESFAGTSDASHPMHPKQPNPSLSTQGSFLSAIKCSLAEHRMTFFDQPA